MFMTNSVTVTVNMAGRGSVQGLKLDCDTLFTVTQSYAFMGGAYFP